MVHYLKNKRLYTDPTQFVIDWTAWLCVCVCDTFTLHPVVMSSEQISYGNMQVCWIFKAPVCYWVVNNPEVLWVRLPSSSQELVCTYLWSKIPDIPPKKRILTSGNTHGPYLAISDQKITVWTLLPTKINHAIPEKKKQKKIKHTRTFQNCYPAGAERHIIMYDLIWIDLVTPRETKISHPMGFKKLIFPTAFWMGQVSSTQEAN